MQTYSLTLPLAISLLYALRVYSERTISPCISVTSSEGFNSPSPSGPLPSTSLEPNLAEDKVTVAAATLSFALDCFSWRQRRRVGCKSPTAPFPPRGVRLPAARYDNCTLVGDAGGDFTVLLQRVLSGCEAPEFQPDDTTAASSSMLIVRTWHHACKGTGFARGMSGRDGNREQSKDG